MSKWRNKKAYRVWRANVIRRDVRCVICGSMGKRHAHHINHATYYPDKRYDLDNGVTLCSKCHMNFHNNFMRSYRSKCSTYEFNNFKVLMKYALSLK